MTIEEAGKLRIGDAVVWCNKMTGKVEGIILGTPNLVVIAWADGRQSTLGERGVEETWGKISHAPIDKLSEARGAHSLERFVGLPSENTENPNKNAIK